MTELKFFVEYNTMLILFGLALMMAGLFLIFFLVSLARENRANWLLKNDFLCGMVVVMLNSIVVAGTMTMWSAIYKISQFESIETLVAVTITVSCFYLVKLAVNYIVHHVPNTPTKLYAK